MKTIAISSRHSLNSAQLHRELSELNDPFVCILDDLTRLQWEQAFETHVNDYRELESHIAIVTAPVVTALGKRLGYEVVTSLCEGRTYRRRPLRIPEAAKTQRYFHVGLPNEGWVVLRPSLVQQLGGLQEELAPWLAVQEFALRCFEQGYACVSDTRRSIHRVAGYAESCLIDEQAFSDLRTQMQWQHLIGLAENLPQQLEVDILLTGAEQKSSSDIESLLQRAGYPIARLTVVSTAGQVVSEFPRLKVSEQPLTDLLAEALVSRRNRALVIANLAEAELPERWLSKLVRESQEREDVGIVVLGSDGVAGRIHQFDAHATLFRPERLPVRSIPQGCAEIHTFIHALQENLYGTGIGIRQTADTLPRRQSISHLCFQIPKPYTRFVPAKVSIITLSYGVNDVNELTVNRLRANTRDPYEISVIVNRGHKEIIKRLETDSAIKLYIAGSDSSRAEQLSLALAQADGEYLVILRDDVVIPDTWLDPLEQALQRIPHAGIVAPRVSNGSGSQIAENERFANTAEFHLAAKRRRNEFARTASIVTTLSQPIFVLRRDVVQRVGAFDPAFGLSELGIVDYVIRVQAAGYTVVIAEDAILHRIHPDLIINKENMIINESDHAKAFSKKWQLERETIATFNVSKLLHSELSHAKMHIPVMQPDQPAVAKLDEARRAVFLLTLNGEATWQEAAKLVKKYHKAFTADDPVSLAIGCGEATDVASALRRVEKIVRDLHIDIECCADVIIADARNRNSWLEHLPEGPRLLFLDDEQFPSFPRVKDLSSQGLRKTLNHALGEIQ